MEGCSWARAWDQGQDQEREVADSNPKPPEVKVIEVSIGDKYIRVSVPKDEMKEVNGCPYGLNLVTSGHYM